VLDTEDRPNGEDGGRRVALLDPREEYGYAEPLAYPRAVRRFGDVLDAYRTDLHGFVARRVCDPSLVDDIVQETLLRAYRARHGFDETKPVWPWLATIARNTLSNALRGERLRHRHLERELDWGSIEGHADLQLTGDPERRYAAKEQHAAILAALATLDHRQRRLLVMRASDGLGYDDIARLEGLTLNSVKSLLKRARHAFRDAYRKLEGAPAALPALNGFHASLRLRLTRMRARAEYAMFAARCTSGLESLIQALGVAGIAGALLLTTLGPSAGSRPSPVAHRRVARTSYVLAPTVPRNGTGVADPRQTEPLLRETVGAAPAGRQAQVTLGGQIDTRRQDRRSVRLRAGYQVPGQGRGEDVWVDIPCEPADVQPVACDVIDGTSPSVP